MTVEIKATVNRTSLIGCRCKHKGSWLWFPLSLDASPADLYEVAEKHHRHFSYFTPEQIFTTNLQLFKTITLEPAP